MKKLTRILLVVMTLAIIATSVSACSFSDVTTKITDWIDKAYDYIVTGCVHEGGTATCTEKAICKICGRAYGKPLGHTPETIEGVSPTCTESGITDGSRCKVCGEILESQKPLSALGHTWSEWTVTTAATCTENGEHERTCATCNEKETEVITATGHEFGDWEHTTPATCTAGGEDTRTCKHDGCDVAETRTVSAKGHTEEVKLGKDATCTTPGLTDGVYCTECEQWIVAQKTIPATQHDYKETVVDSKCEAQGYTLHKCKNCDDEYKSDYTMPTGHSFGEWQITKNASCTEEGVQTRTCACGKTETMPTAKTAHNYKSVEVTKPTCTTMGYTTHTCDCGASYVDNYVNSTEHSYTTNTTEPTCTEAGYTIYTCTCGKTYTSDYVPANGHTFKEGSTKCDNCDETRVLECKHTNTEKLDAVAATCTTDGLTEGLVCKDCKAVLTAQKIVPSKGGHDLNDWTESKAPTCTANGEEKRTCKNCSYYETRIVEAKGHSYIDKTVAPTCTEAGYVEHTCSCGYSYKDNYKAALGHDVSEWTQTKAPTCTDEGEITGTCSRCEQGTVTVKVAALGHKGGTATCKEQAKCTVCHEHYGDLDPSNHKDKVDTGKWYYDGSSHWNQYNCCGAHANTANHSGGEATCTDAAVCGTCGQSYGTANGHSPVNGWINNGDGTHYQKCENCTEHLNSTKHTYSETWEKDENGHWQVCACGATTTVIAHTFKEGQCEICGQNQPKTLRISTLEDLLAFRDAVNGGETFAGWTVYLVADIKLGEAYDQYNFGGIGANTIANHDGYAFHGIFEGGNHTITGFMVTSESDPEQSTAGFFNSLGDGAIVRNLTIENSNISSVHYAGGIAGYITGNVTIYNCTVMNCHINSFPGKVSEGTYDGGDKVGGIVGYVNDNGTIEKCTVDSDDGAIFTYITGYRDIGGIAGYINAGTVLKDCTVRGYVTLEVHGEHDYKNYGSDKDKYDVGVIVGENDGGKVDNCNGKVSSIEYSILCSNGHTWADATCTAPKTCTTCGKTEGTALGHDFSEAWTVDKTNGTHYHACSRCEVRGSEAKHGGGEDTCTSAAVCSDCGETYGTILGHEWATTWSVDTTKGTHYHACSRCEVRDSEAAHTGGTATCQKQAECEVCHQTYGEKNGNNHTNIVDIDAVAATCGKDGSTAGKKCSDCGTVTVQPTVVPATGNHIGGEATCTSKAICTLCGQSYGEFDANNHTGTLSGWQSDANGHWQYYDCHPDVHVNEGTHTYDENGKCVCGRENHVHTYTAVEGVAGLFHCSCGKDFKIDSTKTTWELLTDVSKLTAGSKIVIVGIKQKNGEPDTYFALSTTQNDNNRGQIQIAKNDDGTITINDSVQIITVENGNKDNTFAFNVGDGYLYAAGPASSSSTKNHLKTESNLSDNSSWTIVINSKDDTATITAQGSNTPKVLQYNAGNEIFSCYKSTQASVLIYIQHEEYTYAEVPEHVCKDNVTGATCTADGTCSVCGRTVADSALGHDWKDATCVAPETCSRCPETRGEADLTKHVYANGECTVCNEQQKLYLKPNSNWTQANARFAAYFFGNDGTTWVDMTDTDGDGIYEVKVPAGGYKSLIFVRMNPNITYNDWTDGDHGSPMWNQSSDLVVPTNCTNCYEVAEGAWDKGAGTWMSYQPNFYVRGTLVGTWDQNDANLMTFDSATETWTKVYTNVNGGDYEVKVTNYFGTWFGDSNGANVNVHVGEDYSTVTVKFQGGNVTVVVENHVHNYTYTNNGDNHTKVCTCETITEDHTYVDGYCACGAEEGTLQAYYMQATVSGTTYYWNGTLSSDKGGVTDDISQAQKLYIEDAGDGNSYVYYLNGETKKYIYVKSNGSTAFGETDTATALKYYSDTGYLSGTVSGNERYFAIYKTQDIRTYKSSSIKGIDQNYMIMTPAN